MILSRQIRHVSIDVGCITFCLYSTMEEYCANANISSHQDKATFLLDQYNQTSHQKVNNKFVKQITFESNIHKEDWKKLIALRNENIVTYELLNENFVSYLVMDLCLGSMLDFCQKKLPVGQVFGLDLSLCMWDAARGLEFLHENGIVHGRLGLDKIMLWRKRPKFKPIVKISGYIPHSSTNKPLVADDLVALGHVFYSMATNDISKPNKHPVLADNLTEMSENQRQSASQLLNLLIKLDTTPFTNQMSVKLLLRHPFFTQNLEKARVLLFTSTHQFLTNVNEFQNWYDQIAIENYTDIDKEDFDDVLEILSSTGEITETIEKTFRNYSVLISEFIWHLYTTTPQSSQLVQKKNLKFIKEGVLASGAYGIVYKGKWTNEDGTEIPAAGKILRNESKNDTEFIKEFKLLQKIDHLFVIKCYEMCKIESQTCCIVMELCVGSLENYIVGKLDAIPKNTLDDKILLGQVTLGLAYIHSRKMIHKDLKPANILLWKSPTSALVLAKIADLGFAKQLKPGQEEFSKTSHLGTEKFMAPELLVKRNEKEAKVSYESDAYSLGIVIGFTVLKGRHPYGDLLFQTPLMSKGCEPILLEELKWDVTDLILKLTKAEPSERPSVALVIYHPYFMLTNDKTKAFIEEKVSKCFLHSEDFDLVFSACFKQENIEAWIKIVNEQTSLENNKNAAFIQLLEDQYRNYRENFQETLFKIKNCKENYGKIENAVTSSKEQFFSDLAISKKLIGSFARNSISNASELFVSFVWYLLTDNKLDAVQSPLFSMKSRLSTDCLNKFTECAFGCLYFEKEEEIEELWTRKQSLKNVTNDQDIYRLLCELPPFATPQKVLDSICNKFDDINYFKDGNGSVLHWLLENVWWGDTFPIVETLTTLLKKGANPNLLKEPIGTAIHCGAVNESISGPKIMELLLKNDGNPNINVKGLSPIDYVVNNISIYAPTILRILLENGGNPNNKKESNETSLCYAIKNISSGSAYKFVKTLVEYGASLENINVLEQTALHCATFTKSSSGKEIVKFLLLEKGQDPNSVDSEGTTPVHLAAWNKLSPMALEIMHLLLENGGNPNSINRQGATPLHISAFNESSSGLKLTKMLLEKGGNPNSGMEFQFATPVHYAAKNRSRFGPEIMKVLLERGGNPGALCENKTPVHWAVLNRSEYGVQIMQTLLEGGGDPNAIEQGDLWTPVHYAADFERSSGPEIMKILLQKGGDPNTMDAKKMTPVHLAVLNTSRSGPTILKILLENGGDLNVLDEENKTPLDYVSMNRRRESEILAILESVKNFST